MRRRIAILASVLLAGCTDRSTPTATRAGAPAAQDQTGIIQGKPADTRPMMPTNAMDVDTTPVLARIEAMVTSSLAAVPIPPDAFSQASDAVHPDVACAPEVWNGSRCWATYTPYAGSNAMVENPSFLMARTEAQWATPPGVTNPVVPSPAGGGYNSDPDQAFDPGTNRLVTFYREVSGGFNKIYVMSTGDGRQWTVPQLAFKEPNHNAVSPAVVIGADRVARMWYVETGGGCGTSQSRVHLRTAQPTPDQTFEDAAWSPASDVDLVQPGSVIWHMDVIALPRRHGYLALMASYAPGNDCASDDVWLAISHNGTSWRTFPVPVIWRGMARAKQLGIRTWYRSTMRYDADTDTLHIWPSALTMANKWGVYHAAVNLSDLMRALLAAKLSDRPAAALRMPSLVPYELRQRMP